MRHRKTEKRMSVDCRAVAELSPKKDIGPYHFFSVSTEGYRTQPGGHLGVASQPEKAVWNLSLNRSHSVCHDMSSIETRSYGYLRKNDLANSLMIYAF